VHRNCTASAQKLHANLHINCTPAAPQSSGVLTFQAIDSLSRNLHLLPGDLRML
jgi:hypothetical protein